MRILVIGGAGYIGSHVARAFLDRGYAVTVFDNFQTGLRENLFHDAAFVYGDIMRPEQLREAMREGFDGCVHLATGFEVVLTHLAHARGVHVFSWWIKHRHKTAHHKVVELLFGV